MSYAEDTLGGVFPARVDRMEVLVRTLREDHWPPELTKTFELLRRYYVLTQGVPSPSDWASMLRRAGMEPAVREGFLRVYKKCWDLPELADHEWRYALDVMREDRSKQLLLEGLTDAVRVLTEGVTNKKGERAYGYDDSRMGLAAEMSRIESLQMDAETTPEGDVLSEAKKAWADYKRRQTEGIHEGVMTGFDGIDGITYGAQRGEFWLIAGYTGHGKTQMLTNMAWRAVVDGHNVVYFTMETLRDQVARRFHVRHSHHPRFQLDEGLLYDDLKAGALNAVDEKTYQRVLHDLQTNEAYGKFEVIWAPRGTTTGNLTMKLDILQLQRSIDLVVVDYVGLMGPDLRVQSRQEGLVDILQGMKGMATGHNRGQGVPVVSAYQTGRIPLDRARESGGYTLSDLAETAEAERSADLVAFLLRQHDEDTDVRCQVLKYRDGSTWDGYFETDFARSILRDKAAVEQPFESLI